MAAVARKPKADPILAAAVEQAHAAAVEASDGLFSVGDHLGMSVEGDRVVTHVFECTHPGYLGWNWSVTLVRASRAKLGTVNEVVLLPGEHALTNPGWIPWSERLGAGDVQPGTLMPSDADDPRLEPGFTGGERAGETDPAEASTMRAVVAELGLGRERVLSPFGRDDAAERWLESDGGPDNSMTKLAPGSCDSCGYFVRLQGNLGMHFGACSNVYSPSDRHVVSIDHGCGAHSDVVAEKRETELPPLIWDAVSEDDSLFD